MVAGGQDMGAGPPCPVSVSYLSKSCPSQPGAAAPAQASETPGRAGPAYLPLVGEVACPCFGAQLLVTHPQLTGSDPKASLRGQTRYPKFSYSSTPAPLLWEPGRPPAYPILSQAIQ